MNIGDKIFEYRKKLNLSQEDLAFKLDVSRQSISLWETNQSIPAIDKLKKLAEIFDITLDELCDNNKSQLINDEEKPFLESNFKETVEKRKQILSHLCKKPKIICIIGIIVSIIVLAFSIYNEIATVGKGKFGIIFFGITLIFFIVGLFRNIKFEIDVIKKNSTSDKLYTHEVLFYEEYVALNKKNATVTLTSKKNYSELKTKTVGDVLLLKEHMNFYFVDINQMGDYKDKVLEKFGIIKDKSKIGVNKKKKIHKPISIIFMILSYMSMLLVLIIANAITQYSKYPDLDILLLIESFWLCFVFIPIPVFSLVWGIVSSVKGIKTPKNIVAGIIMIFVLVIFGSFKNIYTSSLTHDYQYFVESTEEFNLNLPDYGYVTMQTNKYVANDYEGFIAVVTFEEEYSLNDILENEQYILSDTQDEYFRIKTATQYNVSWILNCESYCYLNIATNQYNSYEFGENVGDEFVLFAYDADENYIYVFNFIAER